MKGDSDETPQRRHDLSADEELRRRTMHDYRQIIATIERNIATFPQRIEQVVSTSSEALAALATVGGGTITPAEASAIRCLESAFGEAMHQVAWLLHRRGDDVGAREVLTTTRHLHKATLTVLDAVRHAHPGTV